MWKRKFYRLIDGMKTEDTDELLKIEEELFSVIKNDIFKDSEEWTGSLLQNKECDKRIAATLRSSFKSFEKKFDDGAFKFFRF